MHEQSVTNVAVKKPAWCRGPLIALKCVIDEVHGHALASYRMDEESCGFLIGPASDPFFLDGIVRMDNRANKLHAIDAVTYPRTARTYFDLDPLRFAREVDGRAADGRPVKVLYHSHLDTTAHFSETDAAAALMGGSEPAYNIAYLITSVVLGKIDEAKLYVWSDERREFFESQLLVVERR